MKYFATTAALVSVIPCIVSLTINTPYVLHLIPAFILLLNRWLHCQFERCPVPYDIISLFSPITPYIYLT